MAFTSGTASSLNDLLTQIFSFAVTNGWTQDQLDTGAGKAALSKNSVFISMRWDPSTPLQLYVRADCEPAARAFLAGR